MVLDPNTSRGGRLEGIDGPVDLGGRVIAVSMPCPACGYDLRGAPATGQCAECGHAVTQTLASAIDPTAHRLPRLADPRAVGDGLALVTLSLAGGIVLPVVGVLWAGAASLSGRRGVSMPVIESMITVAFVFVLVGGAAGCICLKPRQGGPLQSAARRAVLMTGSGCLLLAGGLVALITAHEWIMFAGMLAAGIGLMIALAGVRRVLVEAGRRCRLFRTATFRRQRIPTLMLAAALATTSMAGARLARLGGLEAMDLTLGALGLIMSSMLAVGLIYLVTNALWIRKDLRQPPPRLADLLE